MFQNTKLFSEAAEHFKKYGTYCPDPPGSIGYNKYWDEQERRCKQGYSVGGFRITGAHYFYLNFCQIKLTDKERVAEAIKTKDITIRGKTVAFPNFWDGDYEYFHTVETARLAGKHLIIDKCRRRGYSYKNGALGVYDYNFIRNSFTIVGAFEKKYLYPNGTMAMINNYMNFLNQHTAWSKRRDEINRIDHKRSSFVLTDPITGITTSGGYGSEVTAITYKDNPDAARGKDASLILLEEAGKFDNLKAAFLATKPCVEDGNQTIGQIIVFGTGGDMEGGSVDFSEMFYDPEPYNFMAFDNIWDEAASGSFCGLFVPDYMNKEGFIDADGNSDKIKAIEYEENKRETIKKAKDPTVLTRHLSEYPFCPAESFLVSNFNILPIAQLQIQEKKLMTNAALASLGTPGKFVRIEGRLVFKPDYELKQVTEFPLKAATDMTGCPVVYFDPYRVDGEVPSGLYYIGHDPYAQDSGGLSLGAAYVLCRPNKFTQPDDIIVAEYVGRPQSQDEYNKILFELAEYYNAKIGFENDRGEIIPYAKRYKRMHQLQEEFQMLSNKDLQSTHVNRGYGMHMTDKRKDQGEIYLRDWLNTVISVTKDGKVITNVDRIYSLGLCRELIRFNKKKGNFDRAMALIIAMYHSVELYDKEIQQPNSRSAIDAWFDEHFDDEISYSDEY
jgi:hypothetical protein